MGNSTFEGIVENGVIRLRGKVTLPEKTRVYVVVPDPDGGPRAHVASPRLAHPEQASDFAKEIVEVVPDDER
jgi:hypothetical protein